MSTEVLCRDPEVVSGVAVFPGTRVPVYLLFRWLAADSALSDFLDEHPTVTREQVLAVLEAAKRDLTNHDDPD
jgi:uncharacterized protein (DUF433 family)